jgi:hypothetical protein
MKHPLHLTAGSTVVEFTWDLDRWRHEVTTPAGRWTSLEGAERGDPRWPDSPVLVEVSRVELAGGPVILGVGLAGRSHFSLSVAVDPDRADTLLFEAACRIQESAHWLGSSYTAPGDAVVRFAAEPARPPATVTWGYRIGPGGGQRFGPPAPAA